MQSSPGASDGGARLAAVRDGVRAAWPICLGYLPIGLAFGVLAAQAGLRPWQVGLMSAVVFAGSSQFIAVAMLQAGAGAASIVATTFLVNLRHTLMSSALAVWLGRQSLGFLSLFAYGVTDESFSLHAARFREDGWDGPRALVANHVANLAWLASTVAGAYAGQLVPPKFLGIDYAMTAMFLCLLVYQVRGRVYLLTALLAAVLSVGLYFWLPGNLHVLLASTGAATGGFLLRRTSRGTGRP